MPNWSIFFGDLCREFVLKTIQNINDNLQWLQYTVATIPSQPSPKVSHKFGSKPRCMPKSKSMRCPSKQLSSNRVSPHLLLQGFPQWRCAHQRHPKMCEFDVNLSHLSKIMETKIFIENTRTGCFGVVSNSPPKKNAEKTWHPVQSISSSPVQYKAGRIFFVNGAGQGSKVFIKRTNLKSHIQAMMRKQKRFWEMLHVNAGKSSVLMWWNVVI